MTLSSVKLMSTAIYLICFVAQTSSYWKNAIHVTSVYRHFICEMSKLSELGSWDVCVQLAHCIGTPKRWHLAGREFERVDSGRIIGGWTVKVKSVVHSTTSSLASVYLSPSLPRPHTLLKNVVTAEPVDREMGHTEVTGGGGQGDGGGRGGLKRRMRRFFLYPAFLPLIGVPPGEVIWMQIRLEIIISIKRREKSKTERDKNGRRAKRGKTEIRATAILTIQ